MDTDVQRVEALSGFDQFFSGTAQISRQFTFPNQLFLFAENFVASKILSFSASYSGLSQIKFNITESWAIGTAAQYVNKTCQVKRGDTQGRAITSEHAGGVEKILLAFNVNGSTTAINALNKQTICCFADIAGARGITKVEGQPTANCVDANQDCTYTPDGWTASKTDWKGIKTTFTISRTEAFATLEARTITTEWHPTLFVKTKVTEPEKETIYSYDTNGHLLNQATQAINN